MALTDSQMVILGWSLCWGVYGVWLCLEKLLKEFKVGGTGRVIIQVLAIGAFLMWAIKTSPF